MGVCAAVALAIACGGQVSGRYNNAKVGEPCTLAIEGNPSFAGFEAAEVSVELPAPDADPGVIVCLANHFRGRVTCPYGQDATGTALPGGDSFGSGAGPCKTPAGDAVTVAVEPQCSDRRAASVVTWSCRCANAAGKTDDGATYCGCPDGTTCEQLVAPVAPSPGSSDVSGAYCVPKGTSYAAFSSCSKPCDPNTTTCP